MSIAYSLLSAVYLAFINEALQLTFPSQNTSRAEQPSGSARFLPFPAFPSLLLLRRGEPRYPQPAMRRRLDLVADAPGEYTSMEGDWKSISHVEFVDYRLDLGFRRVPSLLDGSSHIACGKCSQWRRKAARPPAHRL